MHIVLVLAPMQLFNMLKALPKTTSLAQDDFIIPMGSICLCSLHRLTKEKSGY